MVAVLAIVAVRHFGEEPPPSPAAIRLSFPVPDGAEPGSGDEPLDAAISPDESQIVFVATADGVSQLWRRPLNAERAEPIPGTEGAQLPAWKRTGNVVSFFANGHLKQISLPDGAVADLAPAPSPSGATWLSDGSLLFAADASGPIRRLLDGALTDATTLAQDDTGHVFPVAVPPADEFVYVAVREDGRRIVRLAADGVERELTTTSGHAMLAGDLLLLVQDGVLLAYRLDRESFRLSGRGVPLALDVGVSAPGRGQFAASPGLLFHAPSTRRTRALAWLDARGADLGTIGDAGDHWQVRLSPDDRYAAVTSVDALLRTLDVFIVPASGTGATERLTLSLAADTDPVWSPDGARVMFRSMQDGQPNLFARRAHTPGAADEPILRSALAETPTDWRTDGALFHARVGSSLDVFRLVPGDDTPAPVARTAFNETDARWSPDGQWMAYVSDESGRPDIYAQRRNGDRVRISFGGGTRPRWSGDGRTIFFLRGPQLLRATLDAGGLRFTSAQSAFNVPGIYDFDVAHRTERFLVIRITDADARASVGAILNWTSLIQ